MEGSSKPSKRLGRMRILALIAVGIAIGTTMTATPAVAHVGGTVAHLRDHLKAYFFTKSASDARYANAVPGTDKAKKAAVADNAATAAHATNADRVDGFNANELIRGASAVTFLNSGSATTASATVLTATAPKPGGLFVSLDLSCASFEGTSTSRWDVYLTVDGVPHELAGAMYQRPQDLEAGENLSQSTFAPVSAGNHTIGYSAERVFGNASLDCDIGASSVFMPFGNTGVTANVAAVQSVSAASGRGNRK